MLDFTGERIVPNASNCEPLFAEKMYVEHIARYHLAAQLATGARVLDVGCGVGYGTRLLAEAGAREIIAFDLSAAAIAHARQAYAHPAISFQEGNATDFAFEGAFDLVTCFELIEHVDDQEAVFRCIAAALKPDGVLVMSTPRALAEKRTSFHTTEYSELAFRAAIARHFRHHRLVVENNHFVSLVTDGAPAVLDQVQALHPQFGLDSADYFIALASQENVTRLAVPKPVIVLGNDAYVKRLELDEGILQQRRVQLEDDVSRLRLQHEDEASRLRLQRENDVAQLRLKLDESQAAGAALEQALADARRSFTYLARRAIRAVLRYGARWARRLSPALARVLDNRHRPPIVAPPPRAPRLAPSPDILFFIGCWEGESQRYRVHNVAEALRLGGRTVEVLPFADLGRVADEAIRPKLVVLFRACDDAITETYFAYARQHGIRTLFDTDDLIFEPDVVDRIDGFNKLHTSEQEVYRAGVAGYRKLLLKCDAVTTSTEPLARAARALGMVAHVVPNSWNHLQASLAERLLTVAAPANGDSVVIGYFSGSRTHDADFAEAAPALVRLMQACPQVRLRIVGELDVGAAFAGLANRIERLDFMPYQQQLAAVRECDITIAPLTPGNPFNEAKSELKWFESALVAVPCVATPTEPFRAAIRHGETGFLAENGADCNGADWFEALHALVTQPALRQRMGAAARQAALAAFGPEVVARAAEAAYDVPAPGARPAPLAHGRKRIDWIVPGLIIGSGGHRNILRAAYFLECFGHDVGLVFTDTEHSEDTLRALLHTHFYPFKGEVRRYDGVFRYTDVLFATHWSTVSPALRARGMAREVMYFVQDYEPMFAPMGTEYILAENTYRQGLYCITSGPWCEIILKRDYGAQADHFEFPIDRQVYFPRPRTKQRTNVIYFAKPEMPRRCYDLGVMMLRELHRLLPDVEIIMYGSANVNLATLGFPATLQGVLPTIDDLAQAYADADLGIAFSTTNPSLVPYEMLACGIPVVDLGRPGNELNYGSRTDIALLADPDPARMARQVRDLLLNPAERAARSRAGIAFVSTLPDEEQMARRVEELILRRLEA